MDGRTVHTRHVGGDLDRANGVRRRHRAQGYHQVAVETTGTDQRDIGAIHRHVALQARMANLDTLVEQCLFERERAADGKRHEIVLPQGGDILARFLKLAVTIDVVGRQVVAQVDVLTEPCRGGRTDGRDIQQRAGLGVGLAELQEFAGSLGWQDDQVGLGVAGSDTAGVAGPMTAADLLARLAGGRRGTEKCLGHRWSFL